MRRHKETEIMKALSKKKRSEIIRMIDYLKYQSRGSKCTREDVENYRTQIHDLQKKLEN